MFALIYFDSRECFKKEAKNYFNIKRKLKTVLKQVLYPYW